MSPSIHFYVHAKIYGMHLEKQLQMGQNVLKSASSLLNSFSNPLFEFCSKVTKADGGSGEKKSWLSQ